MAHGAMEMSASSCGRGRARRRTDQSFFGGLLAAGVLKGMDGAGGLEGWR